MPVCLRYHRRAKRDRGQFLMRILITNDDGIHAPGVALLAKIAAQWGEVFVVAPDTERSGVSHAITLYRPLRLRVVPPPYLHPDRQPQLWWACDGTPTDCVYLALNQMELKPDLVLSGINPGPNLGHDVLYSGTVAGALEGAHWGIPSIALSHCSSDETKMPELEPHIQAVLPQLMANVRLTGGTLNVNFPRVDQAPYRGMVVAALGHRYYSNEVVARNDPRGRLYFWIGGQEVEMPDLPGSDCNGVQDGYVTVTPLGDDLTRHNHLSELSHQLGLPPRQFTQRQPGRGRNLPENA